MNISPQNEKLVDLVKKAKDGLIALPDFQRDFVWPRANVESLLDSLLRGHYIGGLLFLETDREHMPFGYRHIAGLSEFQKNKTPEDLVLDGQQRITALHYAFAAPTELSLKNAKSPYRFYLQLEKLTADIEDVEDIVVSYPSHNHQAKALESDTEQFKKKTVPVTELAGWYDNNWSIRYGKWLKERDAEAFNHFFEVEQELWNRHANQLLNFLVPIMTISKVVPSDQRRVREICNVFEKLNSQGVKLTVFDLLTARLMADKVKLRGTPDDPGLWEKTIAESPQIRRFSGGEPISEKADPEKLGVSLLQTIALMRDQDVKSKKLIQLGGRGFAKDWKRASSSMERALQRITSMGKNGFGVFHESRLPTGAVVTVLAALLARTGKKRGPEMTDAIRRWYWTSIFAERYSRATDSKMHDDFRDMLEYLEGRKDSPRVFEEAKRRILDDSEFSLRDASVTGSAIYRGVLSLVALEGPRDFASNDAIEFNKLDDHHIFPKAFLKKEFGRSGADANTILNRTLISASTNRRIKDKRPSEYIESVIPEKFRTKILASHLINTEAEAAMKDDDYDAFIEAREKEIVRRIRELVS